MGRASRSPDLPAYYLKMIVVAGENVVDLVPEPGGLLPREALKLVEGVAKEGIVAMELVEVSPPYDIADITSLLGARLMVDMLAVMVKNKRIGGRLKI